MSDKNYRVFNNLFFIQQRIIVNPYKMSILYKSSLFAKW